MLSAPVFKAVVASLQQSLSTEASSTGSTAESTPASTLNTLVSSQVDTAISRGLPASQAEQAGKSFNQALVQHLSNGLSMSEAVVLAERVFQAEASFPAAKSPQEAAVKNLTASGVDVDAKLTALANTKTSSGTSAFEKSLGIALLKGMSFDDAVKSAQLAAQQADTLANADTSPMSALAGAGDASTQFANTSSSFQKTLSSLLAKGVPLEQARSKADLASRNSDAASRADANNPMAGLASGDFSMLDGRSIEGAFGKVLSGILARGVSIEEALDRANLADAVEQQGIQADGRSQITGFSGGTGVLPAGSLDFDRALAGAINRGESPTQAITSARQAVEKMPRDVQTASTSLASGRNMDTLLSSPGNSRAFQRALGNALARGLPVDRALALANKAEEANSFRFPLSGEAARLLGGKNTKAQFTQADGQPLPNWLRYVPEIKGFKVADVPEGSLPMPIIISVAGRQLILHWGHQFPAKPHQYVV
jgi:hypothetical protein